ncbi:MAG: sulfurtransferase [Micrococcaceae bacterium]
MSEIEYAHPEKLVSTEWLEDHLKDRDIVIVESDEDVLLYETGHIPGAVKIDWHTDLNDPITRDYIDGKAFSKLMQEKGISKSTTVIFYGDKSNWWAAYALWVFELFGHTNAKLLNGGRDLWIAEGREITKEKPEIESTIYPTVGRQDTKIRAYLSDVLKHLGSPLIDVRSDQEYTGERTHMPDYPEEGALRGGHIPTAVSVPWAKAANEDGTFKSAEELSELYMEEYDFRESNKVIVYCRIGERSAHTWFVLKYLLGFRHVRNYDGSWTEYGNAVRVPICVGSEPGDAPA